MTTQRSGIHRDPPPLAVEDWGLTAYADALDRQRERVELRRRGACADALVFTEHLPVYTVGKRLNAAQHLVWDAARRRRAGIALMETGRGGDVTYHGPGQVVCYPILSLAARRDLHAYLRDLEEVVIRALAAFGIRAGRRDGMTGIWIGRRKVCAIGIAVRAWIAYHGFALNLDPDLGHFDGIVPCGIRDGTVTSMRAELGVAPDPARVKATIAVEFAGVFSNAGWFNERT